MSSTRSANANFAWCRGCLSGLLARAVLLRGASVTMCLVEFEIVGSCLVGVVLDGDLDDRGLEAWAQQMASLRVSSYLVLVYGSPRMSSVQRQKVVRVFRSRVFRTAVVTESRFTRGIVTALQWAGVDGIATFPRAELDLALFHLRVPPGDFGDLLDAVERLESRLLRQGAEAS